MLGPLKNSQHPAGSHHRTVVTEIVRCSLEARSVSPCGRMGRTKIGNLVRFIACVLIASVVGAEDFPAAAGEETPTSSAPYVIAWSAPVDAGWEIFFSRYSADGWGPAMQLTANGNRNLVPTVVSDIENTLWLFWSSQQDNDFVLYYAQVQGDEMSEPEVVTRLLSQNMAPSALVDDSGTIWLVWSGFDDSDDDIFFSRCAGGQWDPALRVNRDDGSPDIQPLIGLDADDGNPWVVWRGFDNGRYRFFSSKWTGEQWTDEQTIENDHVYLAQIRNLAMALPDLPADLERPLKGSIHVSGAPIQSFPFFLQPLVSETGASD